MIGFNLGSLHSTVSLGQQVSASRMNCNLLIPDSSGRSTPSIISYTKSHRLIGDLANFSVKKNIKSSFNNISRLTGLNPTSPFTKQEISQFSLLGAPYNPQSNTFDIQLGNDTFRLTPEQIVLAYINCLKQELILNKKIPVDSYVFSVPDYFTCTQKSTFMSILKASGIEKNCHIIQESTAITLYFGHKKYKDYFIVQDALGNNPNSAGVNPTIVKYIIFIDAGYSKTTFVFSRLTYNQFSVLRSFCLPFLGGRNFDQKIFNFCAKKFASEHGGADISKNKKTVLRMLESIKKARQNLTVNTDAPINADSVYEDYDFSYLLTRKEFNSIIKEELTYFEENFNAFYTECQALLNKEGLLVTNIEMAGQLMLTPVLQEIVKKISGLEISKGILVDECIAIGCSLYGAIMKGCFPIQNFQGIYHVNNYSIYSSINGNKLTPFVLSQSNIPFIKTISYNRKDLNFNSLRIAFYHKKDELEFFMPTKTGLLIEYEINVQNLLSSFRNLDVFEIVFLVDNNGIVHVHGMNYKEKGNTKPISGQILPKIIKTNQRELYIPANLTDNFTKQLKENESKMLKNDIMFKKYLEKVNELEGRCYEIKNKIESKGKNNIQIRGKNILDIIQDVVDNLGDYRENITDLKEQENILEEIIRSIIPGNIIQMKADLAKKINDYEEIINVELCKNLEGQPSKLSQEQIDRISNILNHFKTKLNVCDDIKMYQDMQKEFENEMRQFSFAFN